MSTNLRQIVDLRDRTLQKSRIAFGNRLAALDNASDTATPGEKMMLERWYKRFQDMEK